MKKLVAFLLFVNAVFLGARLLEDVRVDAQGGAPDPAVVETGDLNGDGGTDISDAVYFLEWLFRGGPPLVPADCPSPPPATFPATGQSECYNADGATLPCDNPFLPGQDGFHQRGCTGPDPGRFEDNGDGTVTDRCTGLMWMKGPLEDSSKWAEALVRARDRILTADGTWVSDASEADAHGGVKYDDWRLPNVRELESVLDFSRVEPAVDPVLEALPAGYWTSTTYVGSADEAWCINLFEGKVEPILKAAKLQVTLVRDVE